MSAKPMHWCHWLYIVPGGVALSPIGTIVGVAVWKLDFVGACSLIGAQAVGFALLYALSNGGE